MALLLDFHNQSALGILEFSYRILSVLIGLPGFVIRSLVCWDTFSLISLLNLACVFYCGHCLRHLSETKV